MYGSWWHEKNKPVSNSDAARLYGIGRQKAADIYKMLCEEFDLELEPIKTEMVVMQGSSCVVCHPQDT